MSISLNTLETQGMALQRLMARAEETFPPVTPTPSDTYAVIQYRSGQRSVVEWFKQQLEEEGL